MHTYTLTGPTLREAFRAGLLPARPTQEAPVSTADTPKAAFSHKSRPRSNRLLKTLQNAEKPLTRLEIAKLMECSKPTVTREIAPLVKKGLVLRTWEIGKKGYAYHYSLLTINPNPVRRSPHFWWKRCPSCNADRRLKRMASGNYEHWCGCGHFQVISQEMVR